MLNIIKFGGSIVNPDGRYDDRVISQFIQLVKKSKDQFIFVVGGGKLCRFVQDSSRPFLNAAWNNDETAVRRANDWLGISVTKINSEYVLQRFQKVLGEQVYPETILDPIRRVKEDKKNGKTAKAKHRVFFTGGWKPGCSTDKDMMLLAKTFRAEKVFKISDFEIVKKIKPLELAKLSGDEKVRALKAAPDVPQMNWKELVELVGNKWIPGLNTPFDPEAAALGYQMRKRLIMYIGRKEEFPKMLTGKKFRGTVVRG